MPVRRLLAALAPLLVLPAAADAATLRTDRACYAAFGAIVAHGEGFTPGARIALKLDGRPYGSDTADAAGVFDANGRAPAARAKRSMTLTATDAVTPTITAQATFGVMPLAVHVRGGRGARPDRRVRFVAGGFVGGGTLWAHYVTPAGTVLAPVRLGRLRGACGTLTARAKLLPFRHASAGRWHVRFDTHKRYARRTPAASYPLTITVRRA